MQETNKIKTLLGKIKDELKDATPAQKRRAVELLAKASEQKIEEAYTPPTRDELTQLLKQSETLFGPAQKLSKGARYQLHDLEMDLRKLVQDKEKYLSDNLDTSDIMDAVNDAIKAVNTAESKIYQVQAEIENAIKRIGWAIKDIDDGESLAEGGAVEVSETNNKIRLAGYKCYQQNKPMKNPYRPKTPEYESWAAGYHQAVREGATRQ